MQDRKMVEEIRIPAEPVVPATPTAPLLSRKNLFNSTDSVAESDQSVVEETVTSVAQLFRKSV